MIHRAICDLDQAGEPVDPVTVAGELTRRGELARAGGAAYHRRERPGVRGDRPGQGPSARGDRAGAEDPPVRLQRGRRQTMTAAAWSSRNSPPSSRAHPASTRRRRPPMTSTWTTWPSWRRSRTAGRRDCPTACPIPTRSPRACAWATSW
ncbi:DnaB-like helicase N-terminal domain-containing protein [Streptomyces sp. NPDC001774]